MRTGKKYFKGGNPEVFAYFNDTTWKNLTDKEKSMWTPFSDVEQAPISAEVLEFTKSREDGCCKDDKTADLEKQIAELKAEIEKSKIPAGDTVEVEQDRRAMLLEECRDKGLKVTHNMKLETLEKKLNDANDTE